MTKLAKQSMYGMYCIIHKKIILDFTSSRISSQGENLTNIIIIFKMKTMEMGKLFLFRETVTTLCLAVLYRLDKKITFHQTISPLLLQPCKSRKMDIEVARLEEIVLWVWGEVNGTRDRKNEWKLRVIANFSIQ